MIGIVSGGRQIGGAETMCLHLANWLHQRGEDAWLWVGSGGDDQISPAVSESKIRPIGIRDLEWACARSTGAYVYGAKLIGQNKGLAKRVSNAPLTLSYFGGHNPDYADTRNLRVDKFLFESENLALFARRFLKVPEDKHFNCWVPIVVPDTPPVRLFPDRFTFGVVGRLVESKQVLQVIQAFRILDRKDTALVIVGDGWTGDRKMLQHTAGDMENVAFSGLITDRRRMFGMLRGFDCLVSASRHEGIPVVMREAMMFETPIIATDGIYFASDGSRWPGGARELIGDDRGLLNTLNDIGGLVERMSTMIENTEARAKMTANAKKFMARMNEENGNRLLALLKGIA